MFGPFDMISIKDFLNDTCVLLDATHDLHISAKKNNSTVIEEIGERIKNSNNKKYRNPRYDLFENK